MTIEERVQKHLSEGKTQKEAINLAYDTHYRENPPQQFQKGGIAQFKKKPFQLENQRNQIQRDNTPNTKKDLSLMLAEYNNAKKDEQELRTTGQIKNPSSIQYRRNVKTQPEIKQDTVNTEQRNAPLNPLQRPLIYLASPDKLLGDLGVPGMETSELDRQTINANKFNPYQSRTDRFINNAKIGLGYVPEAALNIGMAAAFMPEGSGALGLVNETLNPLAGIKTSLPDSIKQGLRTQGISFKNISERGNDAFKIIDDNKGLVGEIDLTKNYWDNLEKEQWTIDNVAIDEPYRGQGLGKDAYIKANELLNSSGRGSLHSSGSFEGDDAKYLWKSLVKSGKAEQIGEDAWRFKSKPLLSIPGEIRQGLQSNGFLDIFKKTKPYNNFESEINWSNWNKEILDNPKLMNEYNAIEQQAKANGSWMKAPDGSKFKGTPEQFVQQNSENFKNAFPNPLRNEKNNVQINYHGSPTKLEKDLFKEHTNAGEIGTGTYTTTDKGYAKSFTSNYSRNIPEEKLDPTIYELYQNSNNPNKSYVDYNRFADEQINKVKNQTLFLPKITDKYKTIQKDLDKTLTSKHSEMFDEGLFQLGDYDSFTRGHQTVVPFNNYPKSAIGNNGMFDMTNPNIYKSVVPIAGASYLATQEQPNFQEGGTVKKDQEWLQNWYGNRVIPNKAVNTEYQKVKGEYEDVSHAIPYPKYTGYIPPPENIVNSRIEGIRTEDNDIILVSPPNKTTYLHEIDHFIDQNLLNTPIQGIHSRIVEQNIAPKEIIKSKNAKDNYEYLSQPTEVHARLQELRKEAGFKPTQEIKEKDLDNFQKKYKGNIQGINDLYETFDKPHLIEILNSMADNSQNIKDGVLYAQQGGTYTENEQNFINDYFQQSGEKYTQNELNFIKELPNLK